jgi:hypothetical protein
MVAERGICVDHSTVHRWTLNLLPVLEKAFRRCKRPVGKSWRMDETYIHIKGEWRYFSGPSTRRVTLSTFCYAPIGTRLPQKRCQFRPLNAINADREVSIKIRQVQISQQRRRAGPSGDQVTHATHAGVQDFSLRPDFFRVEVKSCT